jgi:hypothetical protein
MEPQMAKIKSTIDLIMEKTKHLSLNEEEKDALEQKDLHRRVQAILVPYLKGERDANFLAHELNQFPSDAAEEGRKLCLELLANRLSPLDDNQRILSAVGTLLGESERDRWEQAIAPLQGEYGQDMRKAWEESAARCLAALAASGLEGPAILPRISEQDPSWKQAQEERIEVFRTKVKGALRR